jgi:Protein of unknown function (DUF2939)
MCWAGRILLALILIWAVYFVSPYVSLYGLAKAVEARDTAAIERRVNFRAVRVSVAKQIIPAYLAATGRESDLKGARGQAVVGIGASIAIRCSPSISRRRRWRIFSTTRASEAAARPGLVPAAASA